MFWLWHLLAILMYCLSSEMCIRGLTVVCHSCTFNASFIIGPTSCDSWPSAIISITCGAEPETRKSIEVVVWYLLQHLVDPRRCLQLWDRIVFCWVVVLCIVWVWLMFIKLHGTVQSLGSDASPSCVSTHGFHCNHCCHNIDYSVVRRSQCSIGWRGWLPWMGGSKDIIVWVVLPLCESGKST